MNSQSERAKQIKPRIAVVTYSISHFEVPLFRIYSKWTEIEFHVFYMQKAKVVAVYDEGYKQAIHWGEDILADYSSTYCESQKELFEKMKNWMPDVYIIYGYSWPGALRLIILNWIKRIPQVHRGTVTCIEDPRKGNLSYLKRPIRSIVMRLFSAYQYGGSYSKKFLTDIGISDKKLFFIPFSVDTDFFLKNAKEKKNIIAAKELRDNLGWTPDNKVILVIGQHSWVKGSDIAMEIFKIVQNQSIKSRFLIVGSGEMTEYMKRYASSSLNPGSYYFAGFCPSKETIKYYLASDIVIFPSRFETWARSVNEAMLCKKICIVNKYIAAAGGLVDNSNGYVVENYEPEKYASAIQHYFKLSEESIVQMGNRARDKAVYMSYENHYQTIKNNINYVLK